MHFILLLSLLSGYPLYLNSGVQGKSVGFAGMTFCVHIFLLQ